MDERAAGEPVPLTAEQAERTITTNLPPVDHHGEIVEAVGNDSITVRLPFRPDYVGAEPWQDGSGQVFSGPIAEQEWGSDSGRPQIGPEAISQQLFLS